MSVQIITNPEVRHDFVFVMEGHLCNPNGDPNAANAPRQIGSGQVYATGTSLSSRISQTAELFYNAPILYKHGNNLEKAQKEHDSPQEIMAAYWDRIGNGGLFPAFGKNKKEAIETGFRGIYRLYPLVSINLPHIVEQAITSPVTNSSDNRVMGNASYADWILAKGAGTFQACINKKRNGIVDSKYMAQWLICAWHHAQQTASLQRGRWDIVDIFVISHESPYGDCLVRASEDAIAITLEGNQKYSINVDAPEKTSITRVSDVIADLIAMCPPCADG